jgi:hypothetical protein
MIMSKKTRVYLGIVAVVVAAAVPAGLMSAGASTAACGSACTSPSVESLSGDVLTVSGSSVVMSAASTSNSAQDWTVEPEGNVTAAANAGVVSSKLELNYSISNLVEFQYAPDGLPSDKCLGDLSTENSTETFYVPTLSVGLVQCGVTAASLWIIDQGNALSTYDDLINAGYQVGYTYGAPVNPTAGQDVTTSPFFEPAVLTVSTSGSGSSSSSSVGLAPLSEIGGVISPAQAWTAYTAPDQSALRTAIQKSAENSSGKLSR